MSLVKSGGDFSQRGSSEVSKGASKARKRIGLAKTAVAKLLVPVAVVTGVTAGVQEIKNSFTDEQVSFGLTESGQTGREVSFVSGSFVFADKAVEMNTEPEKDFPATISQQVFNKEAREFDNPIVVEVGKSDSKESNVDYVVLGSGIKADDGIGTITEYVSIDREHFTKLLKNNGVIRFKSNSGVEIEVVSFEDFISLIQSNAVTGPLKDNGNGVAVIDVMGVERPVGRASRLSETAKRTLALADLDRQERERKGPDSTGELVRSGDIKILNALLYIPKGAVYTDQFGVEASTFNEQIFASPVIDIDNHKVGVVDSMGESRSFDLSKLKDYRVLKQGSFYQNEIPDELVKEVTAFVDKDKKELYYKLDNNSVVRVGFSFSGEQRREALAQAHIVARATASYQQIKPLQ